VNRICKSKKVRPLTCANAQPRGERATGGRPVAGPVAAGCRGSSYTQDAPAEGSTGPSDDHHPQAGRCDRGSGPSDAAAATRTRSPASASYTPAPGRTNPEDTARPPGGATCDPRGRGGDPTRRASTPSSRSGRRRRTARRSSAPRRRPPTLRSPVVPCSGEAVRSRDLRRPREAQEPDPNQDRAPEPLRLTVTDHSVRDVKQGGPGGQRGVSPARPGPTAPRHPRHPRTGRADHAAATRPRPSA